MLEMHSFIKAKQEEILTLIEGSNVFNKGLLGFIYQLSEWIQTIPQAYYQGYTEPNTVYIWFDNIAFAEEDYWQLYGSQFSLLRDKWTIDILGSSGLS